MEKVFHEKGALDGDPRAVLPASSVPLPPKPSRTDSPRGSAESQSGAVCRAPRPGCETSALAFGAAEITVVASSPLVVRPLGAAPGQFQKDGPYLKSSLKFGPSP